MCYLLIARSSIVVSHYSPQIYWVDIYSSVGETRNQESEQGKLFNFCYIHEKLVNSLTTGLLRITSIYNKLINQLANNIMDQLKK